jgi:hypothetical protein
LLNGNKALRVHEVLLGRTVFSMVNSNFSVRYRASSLLQYFLRATVLVFLFVVAGWEVDDL